MTTRDNRQKARWQQAYKLTRLLAQRAGVIGPESTKVNLAQYDKWIERQIEAIELEVKKSR